MNGDSELGRGPLQLGLEALHRRLAGQLELGHQDIETVSQAGAEVDDVGAVMGDDGGDRGNDPGSVRAMNAQCVGLAADPAEGGVAEDPGVDDERAVCTQRTQGGLDRCRAGAGADQQDHRKMTA